MNKIPPILPLIDDDGEVRELTAEDFALFRPAHEVLPVHMHAMLGIKPRGKQVAPTKVSTIVFAKPTTRRE